MKSESDTICVAIRVRPPTTSSSCLQASSHVVTLEKKNFTFDNVLDADISQEAVFQCVGKSVIESCIAGYNGTIFAYGQTGSGKTYSMLGPSEEAGNNLEHECRGVIPRTFDFLFGLIKKQEKELEDDIEYLCKASFIEIYNEHIYDLLDPASNGLQLREDMKRGVFVDRKIERVITNSAEANEVLSCGWLNRAVAATSMNRESSRSHAVFSIVIESKTNKEGITTVKSSQLNLVDLAGSERQKDTQTTGLRLKEAGSINKSLSVLGNVIMALGTPSTAGKAKFVPYRESKLTFLLRDSLGGNAKTTIVACVNPDPKCYGETLTTLNFAKRAKLIKNKAVVNENAEGNITELQKEIRQLKEALRQRDSNKDPHLPVDSIPETPECSIKHNWKERFVQAMFLRHRAVEELKITQKLAKQAQDLCRSNDQALRSSRMVLKFRDETMRKLEMSATDGFCLNPADSTQVLASLKNEIISLEAYIEYHPEVARLQAENRKLKDDADRLKTEKESITKLSIQKRKELTQLFDELIKEDGQDDMGSIDANIVSVSAQAPSELATATLDRLNEQIARLREEKEEQFKEISEKDLKISSMKKSYEDLKNTLKAYQVRQKIEHETQERRHRETLKIMTTPKREKRERIENLESFSPKLNLDESGLITLEEAPHALIEEQVDGLLEENRNLCKELSTAQSTIVDLENSHIESEKKYTQLFSQLNQLQESSANEKASWISLEHDLREEIESITNELQDAIFAKDVAEEEVADLKVMMKHDDVKSEEIAAKLNKAQDNSSALQIKVVCLENELSELLQKTDVDEQKLTSLSEQIETLQDTLDFRERANFQLESSLHVLKKEKESLNHNLEAVKRDLEQQKERTVQLIKQLEEKGSEDERQLLEVLEQNEVLREECSQAEKRAQVLDNEKLALTNQLREAESQCEKKDVSVSELKDVYHSLQEEIGALRQEKTDMQALESDMRGKIDSGNLRINSLLEEKENLECKLQENERIHNEQLECLVESNNQIKFQNANLDEDLHSALASTRQFEDENFKLTSQTVDMEAEIKCLKHEVEMLSDKLNCNLAQNVNEVKKYELQLLELQKAFDHISQQESALRDENSALKGQLEKNKSEISDLAGHQNHQQKIKYVEKIQMELSTTKEELRTTQLKERHTFERFLALKRQIGNSPMQPHRHHNSTTST